MVTEANIVNMNARAVGKDILIYQSIAITVKVGRELKLYSRGTKIVHVSVLS